MSTKEYHVTINGLIYDNQGKLLFLKEINNMWDIPGGRLEHGETFQECWQRECLEEMGVNGKLLEDRPTFIRTAQDVKERWRLMMCFKAELDSF
jgi:ADP-ribose pyrophosphatase YjhB (NUDIX family)